METTTSMANNTLKLTKFELILLSAPVLIGLGTVLSYMNDPAYGVWVDRDMLRATQLADVFQVMGAELNGTFYARTPGGAYYYLLGLLTLISQDPLFVTRLLIVVSLTGAVAMYWVARRLWGDAGGISALGFWLISPIVLGAGYQIINPAFGVPLAALCYLLFIYYLLGKKGTLPWLFFLIGIAIQTHVSYLSLLIAMSVAMVLFCRPDWRRAVAAAGALVLSFSPYLVSEVMSGFVNTRLLILGENEPNPFYTSAKFDSLEYFLRNATNPVCLNESCGISSPNSLATYAGAFLLALLLARVGLAARHYWFSPSRNQSERDVERVVLALGVILIFGIVFIVLGRGFALQHRYYMFLAPAMSLLFAAVVFSGLRNISRLGPLPSAFGRGALIVGVVLVTVGNYKSLARSIPAALDLDNRQMPRLSDLVRVIKAHTGFDHEDIKRRVFMIGPDGSLQDHYISYLARTIEVSIGKGLTLDPASCVAVVESPSAQQAKALLAGHMKLMPFPARAVSQIASDGPYTLFSYALADGNCYTSLGTSYDHFPQERQAREACDGAAEDGIVWQNMEGRRTEAIVLDTFRRTRLCFWVEWTQDNKALSGTLYSWQGRSYSGYPIDHWSFLDLTLEFSNPEGTFDRPLITAPLGRFMFSRMPWHFKVDAPPGGNYDAALAYRLFYQDTMDPAAKVFDKSTPQHSARQVFPKTVTLQPLWKQ